MRASRKYRLGRRFTVVAGTTAMKRSPSRRANQASEIAVLPLDNMSGDAEQEFFADGISEELLNVLVHRVNTAMGHDGMPAETVQLSFGAIKWSYTQQKQGGGVGGKTIAQWSNTTNTPTYSVA